MLTNLLQDPYGFFSFLLTIPRDKMADKFEETIKLPIAIPTWGLILLLCGGIFSFARIQVKLEAIIERTDKLDYIQERQTQNVGKLIALEKLVDQQGARLVDLEKDAWSKPRGK